jgi:hypothetical protein
MAAPREGSLGVLDAKGDTLGVTSAKDVERLAVGADGEVLTADAASALGIKWASIADVPGGVGAGTSFPYGGDVKNVGRFFHAHGDYTAGEAPALDEESYIAMPFAGKLAQYSWSSDSADATTIIRIVINGVVVDTITLTGLFGSVALNGTTFALGARVAIQYGDGVVGPTSGTKPGKGTCELGVQK